jgi:hypothetical protein
MKDFRKINQQWHLLQVIIDAMYGMILQIT